MTGRRGRKTRIEKLQVKEPRLLLLDEPTHGLSGRNRMKFLSLLQPPVEELQKVSEFWVSGVRSPLGAEDSLTCDACFLQIQGGWRTLRMWQLSSSPTERTRLRRWAFPTSYGFGRRATPFRAALLCDKTPRVRLTYLVVNDSRALLDALSSSPKPPNRTEPRRHVLRWQCGALLTAFHLVWCPIL